MPIEGLPHTELVSCPICFKIFNEKDNRPISLRCGHSVCKSCLNHSWTDGNVKNQRCPFDQKELPREEDLPATNFALMQLVGAMMPSQDEDSSHQDDLVPDHPACYRKACQCIVDMALHLKPLTENGSDEDSDSSDTPTPLHPSLHHPQHPPHRYVSPVMGSRCVLSRPIQRKLISLVHCQLAEEEGRSRATRIARSLGERLVSELLLLHQFPHQLSANLWAAVRTRGCQFLGPAMQEEVLRLILLALEDGSPLSRKVLVLFVVQKLEGKYPQASKTAIGHVVQLLYRASCFKVMKRDADSSLMQLKDEFRLYESLRREHDSQIVQIALEAGLRISPEQWSSLLYGDAAHKSHMQSIIDKHQSPQSFAQSLAELMGTLERIGDPKQLQRLQPQLEFLSKIDPSPDCPAPSWENVEAIMRSLKTCINMFAEYLSANDTHRQRLDTSAPAHNARYKTSKCRDFAARGSCPRGNSCSFAHSQEELDRYRSRSRRTGQHSPSNGGMAVPGEKTSSSLTPAESDQLRQIQLLSRLKLDAGHPGMSDLKLQGEPSPQPGSAGTPNTWSQPPPPHTGLHQPPRGPSGAGHGPPHPAHRPPGLTQNLDPEKPPFFPLGLPSAPPTRLTFSRPAIDTQNTGLTGQAGYQSGFHPNSGNISSPPRANSQGGSHVASGAMTGPPPPPSYTFNVPTGGGDASMAQHCPYPSNKSAIDARGQPITSPYPVPVDSASCTVPPTYHPIPDADVPPGMSYGTMAQQQQQQCLPLASLPGPEGDVAPQVLPFMMQEKSLEALTWQKQEIIQHLQAQPVFLDHSVSQSLYKADSSKGFHGLSTVLRHNKQQAHAMPKVVSDMFVATRSTQSLDRLLEDESPAYCPQEWSTGADSVLPGVMDEPATPGTVARPVSSHSWDLPASLARSSSWLKASPTSSFSSAYQHDDEFSRFPGDDGDETFIPFEHTSASRFGPISRLSKTNLGNTVPVQVTADSSEKMTPVLAVTPLERPRTTSMTVSSRFEPTMARLQAEPSVKPTPREIPSVWQQSPLPSYQNIAKLKVGAGEAVSNNERLAYELQAVELEISMKTGQAPEPVSRLIQEAVSGPSPHTAVPATVSRDSTLKAGAAGQRFAASRSGSLHWAGRDNLLVDMGHGHMTEHLEHLELGDNPVGSRQAAQRLMEDYGRSWKGMKW